MLAVLSTAAAVDCSVDAAALLALFPALSPADAVLTLADLSKSQTWFVEVPSNLLGSVHSVRLRNRGISFTFCLSLCSFASKPAYWPVEITHFGVAADVE